MLDQNIKITRALISVSNKDHLESLAKELDLLDVEIISSGGTGQYLEKLGIPYIPIEQITGNPEVFNGRMKTLSFQVASALLFRRNSTEDQLQAKQLNIKPIDLVVCNLYPFAEVVQKEDSNIKTIINNIDIGGPTMIRAAAKNFESVAVCTSPKQYENLIQELKTKAGCVTFGLRKELALEAFRLTAKYDSIISGEFERRWNEPYTTIHLSTQNAYQLRYGENPHQMAWAYPNPFGEGLIQSSPLQGKALSHNNLLDADVALKCTTDLLSTKTSHLQSAVSIIKHLNPCGAALSTTPLMALKMAWKADPISSFGSIISFSSIVEQDCAEWLRDKFVEVIIAPSFSSSALNIFKRKKNLRLIKMEYQSNDLNLYSVRSISGGWLVQNEDKFLDNEFQSMTNRPFPKEKISLAHFGIMATKHLRSNAIALVYESEEGFTLAGSGMGNPNRVVSLQQAIDKAVLNGHKNFDQFILISDAFFPFADSIELAHQAGIQYIVQPGGSIKDQEVIEACNKYQVSMAFTGRRHFRH